MFGIPTEGLPLKLQIKLYFASEIISQNYKSNLLSLLFCFIPMLVVSITLTLSISLFPRSAC